MTDSAITNTESAGSPDVDASDAGGTSPTGRSLFWPALIGFGFVVLGLLIPIPFHGREAAAIGDLAHAPLFGSVTLAVLFLWHRVSPLHSFGRQWLGRIALVALCVFIAGILAEFGQMLTGRSPARHDVVANGMGVIAAVLICIALLNRKYQRHGPALTRLTFLSAIIVVATAWSIPMRILYDVVSVQTSFPLISSFESSLEPTRWYLDDSSISFVDEHVTDGERAMRWMVEDAEHPAVTLLELPQDWSNAQTFELDVTLSPEFQGEATLFIKVMDQDHADYHEDVCRKEFRLLPGQSRHLTIDRNEMIHGPDTRELDLSRIKFVSLMCYRPGQSTWIDVDFMRVQLPR